MAPRDDEEDEMELINAEFESMVSDLNLDQSAPTTYLDELDAIDKSELHHIYIPPRIRRGVHGTVIHLIESIRSWWRKPGDDNSDGAVV